MPSNHFTKTLTRSLRSQTSFYRPTTSGWLQSAVSKSKPFSSTTHRALGRLIASINAQQPPVIVSHQPLRLTHNSQGGSKSPAARSQRPAASSTETPISHATDAVEPPDEWESIPNGPAYWKHVHRFKDVTHDEFLDWKWQMRKKVEGREMLLLLLREQLPDFIPDSSYALPLAGVIRNKHDYIVEVVEGMQAAPMAVRLTPHIISLIDWSAPRDDPVARQFIPLRSSMLPNHPELRLDSLHEEHDQKVEGLVHRYPDKVLFLATSICPVYCRYCTRSYAVGSDTDTVTKSMKKPKRQRWIDMLEYICNNPRVRDVVVSGGDAFMLEAHQLKLIGEGLLAIPHVKRIRFATKGLAVGPIRFNDPQDTWTETFLDIHAQGRRQGVSVALHTHFNHPNEITWTTERAALKLFQNGVIVRNQTVLLRGVNDDVETMGTLIRSLGEMNVQPYYVYQGDMVEGVEDLRTPLWKINMLEQHLRGTIAGYMMPNFVVDLPGGGGKRLACTYVHYDIETGISVFRAPAVDREGEPDKLYFYHDPVKRQD